LTINRSFGNIKGLKGTVMAKKKKKQDKVKVRTYEFVHLWNRGHSVEPDRKKYDRKKKHKNKEVV
jgi:hypothetical protein